MATPRVQTAELLRLLNSPQQPIYLLDGELTIVFINRAAQEWLGVDESLVGWRCEYHSSPSAVGLDAVAAGLCPPPQVLAGESAIATVARTAGAGRSIQRKASFLPIGFEAEGLLGVLAVLDVADLPAAADGKPAATVADASSAELHEQIRRFREEAASRYRAERLIGQGPAMRLARRQVELAAASSCSVLLVGPNGSGRQHLAAAIHYGEAKTAPLRTLVPLDCALLGADLLEAVQAVVMREKLLESENLGQAANLSEDKLPIGAATGTLLFLRIDELSSDVQTELSEWLVRRSPAWRLMATSSQPLNELARRGKFRPDLAAALSTVVIDLPSLVQRRDDLPLLAQLFLEELNATGGRQIGGFTHAALDLLDGYSWPGSLDELAQVVAESHGRAGGRQIDVADLPDRLRLLGQAAAQPRRVDETIVLDEYLGHVERELIRRALARSKGNKTKAARLLGMTRPRLYRRMVQLGLEE